MDLTGNRHRPVTEPTWPSVTMRFSLPCSGRRPTKQPRRIPHRTAWYRRRFVKDEAKHPPRGPVIHDGVRLRGAPRLCGWGHHPRLHWLQQRLIDGNKTGDQDDCGFIPCIADGVHHSGYLNEPLARLQQDLRARRDYLCSSWRSRSAPHRLAFPTEDGVANRARLDGNNQLPWMDVGRCSRTRGERDPEQDQLL